jgi:hypothetical protein
MTTKLFDGSDFLMLYYTDLKSFVGNSTRLNEFTRKFYEHKDFFHHLLRELFLLGIVALL